MEPIPLSKAYFDDCELDYLQDALKNQELIGGKYTQLAQEKLQLLLNTPSVLLTNSCTAALELAALLLDIKTGDEIIMPSFTFPSTANAFVLRGATPVFVDIRADTLNLNERLLAEAITKNTRAIVPMHYGGIACAMNEIKAVADQHQLPIVEDAAQSIGAYYHKKPLGCFGTMSTFSFHSTKNIVAGVGGCLCINDLNLSDRAEILYQKGTNRNAYFRSEVDRYTWVDIGSSFMPNEITAALLYSQLEKINEITTSRLALWNYYHSAFQSAEQLGWVERPAIPENCQHNAHVYYLLLPNEYYRDQLITRLRQQGIKASYHFIPLHSSPAGIKFGKTSGKMYYTDTISKRIVRLPIWHGMAPYLEKIITVSLNTLSQLFQKEPRVC